MIEISGVWSRERENGYVERMSNLSNSDVADELVGKGEADLWGDLTRLISANVRGKVVFKSLETKNSCAGEKAGKNKIRSPIKTTKDSGEHERRKRTKIAQHPSQQALWGRLLGERLPFLTVLIALFPEPISFGLIALFHLPNCVALYVKKNSLVVDAKSLTCDGLESWEGFKTIDW